ncbi:Hexosyltransferase [Fasciolopsis buskii]|uniref:Hexosyltransferase n=1 Tax=Fasciolopsis buskii TaxID=27845 RepID=A0A8E0RK80_9TREM|nr:Hexosyltransferase [Fasciolopsis buski]
MFSIQIKVNYCVVRPIDRQLTEWTALGSLSDVRTLTHLKNEYCLDDSQSSSLDKKINLSDKESYYGSEYLAAPMHVNIFHQICLIISGQEPSVTPVYIPEYNLMRIGAHICPNTYRSLDLLILINSPVKNVQQRNRLRTTWANESNWIRVRVRQGFLLDSLPLEVDETAIGLTLELSMYRDIIQIDTNGEPVDDTMKLIYAFRWSLAFCPQAKWLFFVRDDCTVIPYNFEHFLLSVSEAMRQRLIAGAVWDDPEKSVVDSLLFPGRNLTTTTATTATAGSEPRYLTFVATSPMLVSAVLSPVLYITMRFTEFIDQPELFFAAVMHKLFISPAHVDRIYAFDRKPKPGRERHLALAFSNSKLVNISSSSSGENS